MQGVAAPLQRLARMDALESAADPLGTAPARLDEPWM
jgi:hypothetical protein